MNKVTTSSPTNVSSVDRQTRRIDTEDFRLRPKLTGKDKANYKDKQRSRLQFFSDKGKGSQFGKREGAGKKISVEPSQQAVEPRDLEDIRGWALSYFSHEGKGTKPESRGAARVLPEATQDGNSTSSNGLGISPQSWDAIQGVPAAPLLDRGNNLTRETRHPGAFRVLSNGQTSTTELHDEPNVFAQELAMVDRQAVDVSGDSDMAESGLAQAWLVSEPHGVATPFQGLRKTDSGVTFGLGKAKNKFIFIGILAIATAILVSSLTAPLLLANDKKRAKQKQIKSTIIDAFGESYFDSSQKERALQWIMFEDPRNSLGVEEKGQPTNLLQRFSLVSFYFQTSSQQPWSYCNPPVDTQSDTCYYVLPNKHTEQMGIRWLTAAHECQWRGVICAGSPKQVTELQIEKNNITGTIPADEIAMLTQLKVLNFERNNLTGSLPSGLFQGSSLAQIFLDQNKLTGSIPVQAFMLPKITIFSLSSNLLKGRIPTQIGLFHGKHLRLIGNVLTGSLPEELCAATSVEGLYLTDNLLTGTLSSCIGALTELNVLEVQSNPLEGSIPSQIGLLHRLHTLLLNESNICGTLPEELYQNQALQYFQVGGSKLSGTISTRIGHLKKLIAFEVNNNDFHGTIPAELSGATNLCILSVHGNRNLTGSIAKTFCSQLHQGCKVQADCKPSESNGVPAVVCPEGCCSTCCDAELEVCTAQ